MNRRSLSVLAVAIPALVSAPSVVRKDPTGVYGVIDRVIYEPASDKAERIQLWGVFAIAHTFSAENGKVTQISMDAFHPAQRGYLYYELNPGDESTTRAEWSILESMAGTGQAVAFGARLPPTFGCCRNRFPRLDWKELEIADRYNGRIRNASEPPAQPDRYPQRGKGAPADLRARHVPVPGLLRTAETGARFHAVDAKSRSTR